MLRYIFCLVLALGYCALVALGYRALDSYANQVVYWVWGAHFLVVRQELQALFPLPDWAVYSAPGGVWVFGLALLGWRLWLFFGGRRRLHLFFWAPLLGIGFEVIQYLGFTDGTADGQDLLAVGLGFALAWVYSHHLLPSYWRTQSGFWRYVLYWGFFLAAFVADVWPLASR